MTLFSAKLKNQNPNLTTTLTQLPHPYNLTSLTQLYGSCEPRGQNLSSIHREPKPSPPSSKALGDAKVSFLLFFLALFLSFFWILLLSLGLEFWSFFIGFVGAFILFLFLFFFYMFFWALDFTF